MLSKAAITPFCYQNGNWHSQAKHRKKLIARILEAIGNFVAEQPFETRNPNLEIRNKSESSKGRNDQNEKRATF